MMKADAILCSDLHLREMAPACRSSAEFAKAMETKLDFICELQKEHECPVLCAGDVFDTWRCSIELVYWAYQHLPNQFICVAGQHELPYHRLDQLHRSPLALLHAANRLLLLTDSRHRLNRSFLVVGGLPWGSELDLASTPTDIILTHRMVWMGKPPFPGAPEDGNAEKVLQAFPRARLIVTGDNHQCLEFRKEDRLLVNPGSMMRSSVDQADYRPCVHLWFADTNHIESVPLPIQEGVVDVSSHLNQQDRNNRVDAFVRKLDNIEVTLDFNENLRRHLEMKTTPKHVRDMVQMFIEKSKEPR